MKLSLVQVDRWGSLIKRLEQIGRDGSQSVITVHILTDETGAPVLWSQPERVRFEPKSSAVQILEIIAQK